MGVPLKAREARTGRLWDATPFFAKKEAGDP